VSTVDTLLVQHARGRQLTQLILAGSQGSAVSGAGQISAAMAAFVRMYQSHEAREDTVIFPKFRALLSRDKLDQLGRTFAELQFASLARTALLRTSPRWRPLSRALASTISINSRRRPVHHWDETPSRS
jgi:hypothetical protein